MRSAFTEELDGILDTLVGMTALVARAMDQATSALLDADLEVAQEVIANDEEVDRLYRETEDRALELIARHSPVAGDLRVVLAGLRMVTDLERMGDLAAHVAKVARRRYPAEAVPQELAATVMEMGHVAVQMAVKTGEVIARRDVALAEEVGTDDDRMDRLHRKIFSILLEEEWKHGMEQAVDTTLVGRYYERFGDHCVTVVRRMVFVVTGHLPDRPPPPLPVP